MDKELKHRLIVVLEEHTFRVEDICDSTDLLPEIKVHEIRKSFKRMNALFRLFPDSLKEEVQVFRQPMKALARQLTVARETTVNLQFFEEMCTGNPELNLPETQDLKTQLVAENLFSLETLAREGTFDTIKNLMKTGRTDFLEKIPGIEFVLDITTEIDNSLQKAKDLFIAAVATYHPEEYHELRKKMKILWYQYEFIHPGQADIAGTQSEKLHNITDRLGDDHDWYIFLEEIEHEKYRVTSSYKMILENTIEQFQKANLAALNSSLTDFFQLK